MAGDDPIHTSPSERNSFGDAMLPGGEISAYHASPHIFQQFDPSKLGTGEGETTYGRGLYFAGHPGTVNAYQQSLSYKHKGAIHRYDVKIDVPSDKLLDWDRRISEQSPHVREALENNPKIRAAIDEWAGHHFGEGATLENLGLNRQDLYGENIIHAIEAKYGRDAPTVLREAGIPGMRYLDHGSRGVTGGTATYNYVIYDESKVTITGINGQPVPSQPSNAEPAGTTSRAQPTMPIVEGTTPHVPTAASGAASYVREAAGLAQRFVSKLPLVGFAIGGATAAFALAGGASPAEAASAIPVVGPAASGNMHETALQVSEQTGIGFIPAQVGRLVNDVSRATGTGDRNVGPSLPVEVGGLLVQVGQRIADAVTRYIDGPQLPSSYSIMPGNCGNEPAAISPAPMRSVVEGNPRVPSMTMQDWDKGVGRRPAQNLNALVPVAAIPPATTVPVTQVSTMVKAITTLQHSTTPGL